MRRPAWRHVGIAAITFAALLVVALVVLHTPPVGRVIQRKATGWLEQEYQAKAEFRDLHYNLLKGSISLRHLRISSASVPGMPPFLEAADAYLNIGTIPTLRSFLTLQDLRLEGLRIRIIVDEQGRTNLPVSRSKEPLESLPNFLVESGQIRNASLLFEDRRENIAVAVPSWQLDLGGQMGGLLHNFTLRTNQPATAGYKTRSLPLTGLVLRGRFARDRLDIDEMELTSGRSAVRGTGSVRDLPDPVLHLRIEPRVDMKEAARFAGVDAGLAGVVTAALDVEGSFDNLKIHGNVKGDSITAAGYPAAAFSSALAWSDMRLELRRLAARFPDATVDGSAAISFAEERLSSAGLQLNNFDLLPLMHFLGLPVRLASRATGTFDAQWPGTSLDKVTGRSRFRLTASRQQAAPDIIPVSASASAEIAGGQVRASVESAGFPGGQLSGRAALGQGSRIEGRVQGRITDLHRLTGALTRFLGRTEPLLPLDVAGGGEFQLQLAGTLQNPGVSGSARSGDLRLGDLENVSLETQLEYGDSSLSIRKAVVTVAGQVLEASGSVGFRGTQPELDLAARADNASLDSLLSAFRVNLPAEGIVDVTAQLQGTPDRLVGDTTILGTGLSLYGEPMGRFTARAGIHGTNIETKEFVLEKTPGASGSDRLTAHISYDLESGRYLVEAKGDSLRLGQFQLPGGLPLQGTVSFSASGAGSIDDPRLELQLSGTDVTADKWPVGAMTVKASVAGTHARVRAEVPRMNLGASAEVRLEAPYETRIDLKAEKSDLSSLGVEIANEQSLKGSVTAAANAMGNLEQWRNARVSVLIEDVQLSARDHQVRNEGPIRAAFENGVLRVEKATIVSENNTLSAEGSLPVTEDAPGGRFRVAGRMDLGQLYPFFPAPPGFFVDGLLQLDLALQGPLRRLELVGNMSVSDGFLHVPDVRMPVADIAFSLRMHDGMIELEKAQAQWAAASLEASGRLPLELLPEPPVAGFVRAGGPASFTAAVRGLRLESTSELPERIGGLIGARIEGRLPRADLRALDATATFDTLKLQIGDYALEQEQQTRVRIRDGMVRLDDAQLSGPETRLRAGGTAALTGDRTVNVRMNGTTDAGLLAFLSKDVRAAGGMQLEIAVGGSLDSPRATGTIALKDGQVSLAEAGVGIEDLDVLVKLNPGQIVLEQLGGVLNGGTFKGGGTLAYNGTGITRVNLDVGVENAFFNVPEGLHSLVDADLTVRSTDRPIVVGGTITVAEGSYTEPFNLDSELMQQLRSGEVVDIGEERNALLERLRFDVRIRTQGPVTVDNNLAEIAARTDLRLVGSYYRPALQGRINLEQGGAIYLNERKYVVERGSIYFANPTRMEPSFDIHATTEASNYEIELNLTGPPRDLESTLTSNPPLSEPDIVSVLLTGRTLEETRGEELDIAKEQALSLIAGTAGTRISQTAERALGLSTIRIEPSLIAAESDPGARLTVGQDITRDLRLIYSLDLADAGNQIWVTEYDISRRFTGRGIKQEDNSYRMEFRHDLRLGGPANAGRPQRQARTRREVGRVKFEGNGVVETSVLRDKLNVETGDRYDFFKLQEGRERLSDFLMDERRLESRISMERTEENGTVDLTFRVQPGPEVTFLYEGYPVPGGVREQVGEIWQRGVFDAQRAADAVRVIRKRLVEEGYLQSSVSYDIRSLNGSKSVQFRILPGPRFSGVQLEFSGIPEERTNYLKQQLDTADLELAVYTDPSRVADFIAGLLRRDGFMDAEAGSPELHLDSASGTGRVVLPVKPGPRFRMLDPEFSGNEAFDDSRVRSAAHLPPGGTYTSQEIVDALDRLETFYRRQGYNDTVISHRTTLNRETATAKVEFQIEERRKEVIQEITVEGNEQSSEEFVRRQLTFSEGDVLDFEKVGESRRNLYQTGIFTTVDIQTETLETPSGVARGRVNPVRVTLQLREIRPYRILYGGFYDTERGPGAIADASHRNFLGRAITLGLRTRYDSDLREGRIYINQPSVFGIRLRSSATGYVQRQYQQDFITDRIGFSLFQEKKLGRDFLLTYGYTYERTHTFDRNPQDVLLPFDVSVPIARLTATMTRDSRDDLLDATRGEFNSHAVEYAPELLGSDVRFVKYLGQYFRYVPIGRARRTVAGKAERPGLLYAGAMRVGLAKGFGQEIVRSERFFAGGGTTVRGFEQDQIGPQLADVGPLGGEALFIFNNELRFPIFSIFHGVGFLDIGNVYPRVSDFNPFDVRKSAGFGLRVRTPFFLLRFDFGFKLDRKPDESLGEFFFSIGQAF
jgi:outer membrane protein assembly complex protein YaeT